jgi:hypothetical protein
LEYFPLIAKFAYSKFNTNQKKIACSKHSNLENEQSLFFSNILPNMHHSFCKLKWILILMIRREQGLELMKIIFITHLSIFGSKMLTLKNYGLKM